MKKFIATILWNIAASLVRLAEKIYSTDRAIVTKVKRIEETTIVLSTPIKENFKEGDKILILK